MTPVRVLPPTVAYAAGLICEHRPDLADPIREAVLGDNAVDALTDLARLALYAGGAGGADSETMSLCMMLLGVFWEIEGELHKLADTLGLVPEWCEGMLVRSPDGVYHRDRGPTIGEEWRVPVPMSTGRVLSGPSVCGLPDPEPVAWDQEARWNAWGHEAVAVLLGYLRGGFSAIDRRAMLPTERKAFVMIVRLHAHTVSLDSAERTAWAKAHLSHLDALEHKQ